MDDEIKGKKEGTGKTKGLQKLSYRERTDMGRREFEERLVELKGTRKEKALESKKERNRSIREVQRERRWELQGAVIWCRLETVIYDRIKGWREMARIDRDRDRLELMDGEARVMIAWLRGKCSARSVMLYSWILRRAGRLSKFSCLSIDIYLYPLLHAAHLSALMIHTQPHGQAEWCPLTPSLMWKHCSHCPSHVVYQKIYFILPFGSLVSSII